MYFYLRLNCAKVKGMLKTKDAIELAGSAAKLAQLLGITQSAISQWGEEVPEPRYWQLRVLKPKWFKKTNAEQATA